MTKYEDIMKLAEEYCLEDNALFKSCAEQYVLQQRVIESIRDQLTDDSLTVSKEYVKNRVNVYANPLIKELPKHSDAANKTLASMLSIIASIGKEKQAFSRADKLNKFLME